MQNQRETKVERSSVNGSLNGVIEVRWVLFLVDWNSPSSIRNCDFQNRGLISSFSMTIR